MGLCVLVGQSKLSQWKLSCINYASLHLKGIRLKVILEKVQCSRAWFTKWQNRFDQHGTAYYLDVLPLMANALAKITETCEGFAVRKVEWAAEQYRQENIHPTRTKLIERAGMLKLAGYIQVKAALDTALQKRRQLETAL